MTRAILIIVILWSSVSSQACVWRRMNSPFWESSRIPVCFVEPPNIPSEERQAYENAKQMIREAFRREINARTPLFTYGFENCEYNYHTQGPNGSLPPMVRIELLRNYASASSGSLDGNHGLSFTDARTVACNVQLSYVMADGREGTVMTPEPRESIEGVALHEFMHLLGFQHETYAAEAKVRETALADPDWAIVPPLDPGSIMVQRLRGEHTRHLSEGDVRCIEMVHNREILSHLSQVPTLPEGAGTIDTPANQ